MLTINSLNSIISLPIIPIFLHVSHRIEVSHDTCTTLDENPKAAQIQGPMTRGRTKQSEDTLQQMVSDILNKAKREKDEGPEALPRVLIVVEGLD